MPPEDQNATATTEKTTPPPTKENPPTSQQDDAVLGGEEEVEEEGEESVLGGEDKTDGQSEDKAAAGAPEKYADFTLPEGYEANPEQMGKYTEIAKKLNLSQASAQELLDFHIAASKEAADGLTQHWKDTQKEWRDTIAADPKLGPRIKEVRANFSKMLNSINQAEGLLPAQLAANNQLIKDFREALVLTGIGSNPAFVRLMDRLSQHFTEGAHVKGNGPTAAGQKPAGTGGRPSLGEAFYG